ncbi:hypothetical protein CAC42_4320 [Sphaceloma murrayae]|uniref:Uncharacterized protein n=1 Tax=Sphaceloma murrayae TaxID=2082308 RepID=A0A2K1QM22_9PEZI|nr:hypothetical protein CAC42_4320 [Sphaceloma murrayae]
MSYLFDRYIRRSGGRVVEEEEASFVDLAKSTKETTSADNDLASATRRHAASPSEEEINNNYYAVPLRAEPQTSPARPSKEDTDDLPRVPRSTLPRNKEET